MDGRERAVRRVGAVVEAVEVGHPLRVAVDGITASGKTTFAGELAAVVGERRPVIRVSMDGFHHRRHRRHRRGRESADGYYEDAYDFDALAGHLLRPLGPGGDRRYRPRIIDLATDASVDEPPVTAPTDAVLIVDGTFLQRDLIRHLWDVRIYVDTGFAEARRRGVARDADLLGGAGRAAHLFDVRYHAACRRYLTEVHPADLAHVHVRNDDPDSPVVKVRRHPG